MRFFSMDGPFNKYGTILFDLVALSALWLLINMFSFGLLIPLTTAGLFNAVKHVFIDEDGYLLGSFFGVFRRRLLPGLGLTAIGLGLYGLTAFNIWAVWSGLFNISFLMPLYLMITIEVTMTMGMACALLAETDMTLVQLMKYGFILSNRHMPITILCIAAVALVAGACIFYNFALAFIATGAVFWLMGWLIQTRIFSKYYLDKLI